MITFFKPGKNECQLIQDAGPEQMERYRHFRSLLDHNQKALNLMAGLEQTYYDNQPFTLPGVERMALGLLSETESMIRDLSGLTAKPHDPLISILKNIDQSAVKVLGTDSVRTTGDVLTLPIALMKNEHGGLSGAKAANIARIRRECRLPVPNGFAITTNAFWLFLSETGLLKTIDDLLAGMDPLDPLSIETVTRDIRDLIKRTALPDFIRRTIEEAAQALEKESLSPVLLAARSSAVGEDGELSFAGQYESKLNIPVSDIAEAYKDVVASKYSAPAVSYRVHHGLSDRETPMAVLVLEMIRPRLSGVLYTADPVEEDMNIIRVSAVQGLGEALVGGDVSPGWTYRIDKATLHISGADTPEKDAEFLTELCRSALVLENHYQCPLDIEWAVDNDGRLFFLQARPLLTVKTPEEDKDSPDPSDIDRPVLIHGGKCASAGIAAGKVLVIKNMEGKDLLSKMDSDTILVTRTASTAITPWIGKVKGIITDIGSAASHLASVAREFGVPALFDTETATKILRDGQEITLWAGQIRVYDGIAEELIKGLRPVKRPVFASPLHTRLQSLLDLISPLNITDPDSDVFAQEECRTVHDIIRFCHEMSARAMFRFGNAAKGSQGAVRIRTGIPVQLYALDLGGGFFPGKTTCDELNTYDMASMPFRALWRGLAHPGINWRSTIAVGAHNFMSLMAGGAMPGQEKLGEASYVLAGADYMNLSIRFGYHFATVDTLCSKDAENNYISLQFSGGAGAYFGKSLRIQYMDEVLKRLGFETSVKGDLIEAMADRMDQAGTEDMLDHLGRLLGTTRLLDMFLSSPGQVLNLVEDFFKGRYDILEAPSENAPDSFYLITGNWSRYQPETDSMILQDGSDFVSWISTGVSQAMARVMGKKYQEILDNMGAYYYFPLAIARESHMTEGSAEALILPVKGTIDQAGGIAFGIRDWQNYFVFRINALEDNAILFEFKNGKRIQRLHAEIPVEAGQWHRLKVDISGRRIQAHLPDSTVLTYTAERDLDGHIGLWTKADSVTVFKNLEICRSDKKKG